MVRLGERAAVASIFPRYAPKLNTRRNRRPLINGSAVTHAIIIVLGPPEEWGFKELNPIAPGTDIVTSAIR